MRTFYLIATIVGTVIPVYFFVGFFGENGVDLMAFLGGVFANGAAAGIGVDVVVSSAVFWGVMFSRRRRDAQAPNPLPFMVVNLFIGLSCALPAYLYLTTPKPE